ncbi:MAG: DUF3110 domain-containing protein [Cyanobacteriota bacterium]|nr:DUF3110 domain-containing protein [Cyanobacteriota bacterium]
MRVHVLLFDAGTDQEGIHSLELGGRTIVLLFEEADDAVRYAGLLAAQDFPEPTVEPMDRQEMEMFCQEAGYEARFVPAGFLPQSDEDRLLIAPPERNLDISTWKEREAEAAGGRPGAPQGETATADGEGGGSEGGGSEGGGDYSPSELDALRRQLEGLL